MKKFIKKTVSFLFATALAFSFTSTAFAFNGAPGQIMPLANGYSEGTVRINGVDYAATFYLGGNVNGGGYSGFTTSARCIREHHAVSVTFMTDAGGMQRFSGGEKNYNGTYDITLRKYVGVSGTSESNRVKYSGTDKATGIQYISGTLTATTVGQSGYTASFDFSTSAG